MVSQKSMYMFYKNPTGLGKHSGHGTQDANNPSKKHPKTGNLFVPMEVHMASNPASPACPGPDFRPGYQKNTPRGLMGHQRATNQKNVRDFGVQKMGPKPKSGIFSGNVRNVHGIIFSLLGNYLGPLKIQFSNYLFIYMFGVSPLDYRNK